MAVEDGTIMLLGIVILNYLLFIAPKNWTKNLIGGVLLIIIGYSGYVYMSTDLPWGIIIALSGLIYSVFKLGELGNEQ